MLYFESGQGVTLFQKFWSGHCDGTGDAGPTPVLTRPMLKSLIAGTISGPLANRLTWQLMDASGVVAAYPPPPSTEAVG